MMICRTGVKRLRLVDDAVVGGLANQQELATAEDSNRLRVDVVQRALLAVRPDCEVEVVTRVPSDLSEVFSPWADGQAPCLALDCFDDLTVKAEALKACSRNAVGCVTVCGWEGHADPTRLSVVPLTEAYKTPRAVALTLAAGQESIGGVM